MITGEKIWIPLVFSGLLGVVRDSKVEDAFRRNKRAKADLDKKLESIDKVATS